MTDANRERIMQEVNNRGLTLNLGGTKTISIPPYLLQDMGVSTKLRILGPQQTMTLDLEMIGWSNMPEETKRNLVARGFKPGRINILTGEATEVDELKAIENRVRQYFRRNGYPLWDKFEDSDKGRQVVPVFIPFTELPKFQHYYTVNREEYLSVAGNLLDKYNAYITQTLQEEETSFFSIMRNGLNLSEYESRQKTEEHIRMYRNFIPRKDTVRGRIVFEIDYEPVYISENSITDACSRWLANSPDNEDVIQAIGSAAEEMLSRVSNKTAWLAENIIGASRKDMVRMFRDVITEIDANKFMTRKASSNLNSALKFMKKQFYGEVELTRLTEELQDVFKLNKGYINLKDQNVPDMGRANNVLHQIYAILNVREEDMVRPTPENATSRFRRE